MKELEGKTVYLRPTGNNARMGNSEIVTAKLVKVAKVFAYITREGWNREDKYRMKGRFLDSGYNAGYEVFSSLAELEERKFIEMAAAKISAEFRYPRDYAMLSIDDIKKVADILGVNLSECYV